MINRSLCFENNISMAVLDIETMKIYLINNVEKNHEIFHKLNYEIKSTGGFDYYYYLNQILIIPDPTRVSRLNSEKKYI